MRWTGCKSTSPTVAGVHLGMDSSSARGIDICASSTQYIHFTVINADYKGRMSYISSESSFNCSLGANNGATPNMKLLPLDWL